MWAGEQLTDNRIRVTLQRLVRVFKTKKTGSGNKVDERVFKFSEND